MLTLHCMHFRFIGTLLFITGCQTSVFNEDSVSLEPSLIRSWSEQLQIEEPCNGSSFLATYQRGKHILYFLAMEHSMGPVSGNNKFFFVKKNIEELKPDIILIENQERQLGVSSWKIIKEIERCRAIDFVGCKENIFAGSLALEKGLQFLGAEPSDEDIMGSMNPDFERTDYYGLIWIRNINEWKRKGGKDFQKEIPIIFYRIKERLGPSMDMTYLQFKSWYKLKTGKNFDEKAITPDTIAPVKDSNSYEQRLAYKVDQTREPGIQSTIELALNKYQKVFVVYGGGHHVKQRLAFKKYFGEAKYQCLAK